MTNFEKLFEENCSTGNKLALSRRHEVNDQDLRGYRSYCVMTPANTSFQLSFDAWLKEEEALARVEEANIRFYLEENAKAEAEGRGPEY